MGEKKGPKAKVRAYFSHSYRPEDKDRNLFFWELFKEAGFYFTVDRKPETPTPMYLSYLEWLMKRSACFIAVIPRRTGDFPYNCSRYQVFESELAIRAQKPRLLFVEDGLSERLFVGSEDEVCFFHPNRYQEDRDRFLSKARVLIQKSSAYAADMARPLKDVGLLLDTRKPPYSATTVQKIRQIVRECSFPFSSIINPWESFRSSAAFTMDLDMRYEVLISEVRFPYVPLDILACVQDRCIPLIRICHLEEGETEEQLLEAMHLPLEHRDKPWQEKSTGEFPMVLSGSKLDEGMRPVIFWRDIDELTREVSARLEKINYSFAYAPQELLTLPQARRYFLSIGRRKDQVFISNENTQNPVARELADALEEQGIEVFHYKDLDAIPIGTPDWLKKVYQEIDRSKIFLILLDANYFKSEWCREELERATQRFAQGATEIYPYVVDGTPWPKDRLGRIEGRYLNEYPKEKRVGMMVEDIVRFLEQSDPTPRSLMERAFKLNVVYQSGLGIGTFSGIENAQLRDVRVQPCQLKGNLYDRLSRAASKNSHDWEGDVLALGSELYHETFNKFAAIKDKYSQIRTAAGLQDRLVHFCFATDRDGLGIPFEWMLNSEDGSPICLLHPISRFLTGSISPRVELGSMERQQIRVLLIASNTGDLPNVESEVDDLERLLVEKHGFSTENVRKIQGEQACYEDFRREVTRGDFHILHFAGHGGWDGERGFYLEVLGRPGTQEKAAIYASTLIDWMQQSDLRFVYLSNCVGADATGLGFNLTTRFRLRPIRGMAHAVVEAGVPEVVAFHWPIVDAESRQMAATFYGHFLNGFDAATALCEARKYLANKGAQIWAAPMLIRQY